jgi:hypothetical protein
MRRQGISAAILIGAAMLILCGGCGGLAPKAFKSENYSSLKPGMSKAEVEQKMGKPMGFETRSETEVWRYDWHDPITSNHEVIELQFEKGVYKDMKKSAKQGDND